MDTQGLEYWLKVWYKRVQPLSEGPWVLVMDNCGGQEMSINFEKLKIVLLLSRRSAKHQPLELVIMAIAKIRYRSALLSLVLVFFGRHCATNKEFPPNAGNENMA